VVCTLLNQPMLLYRRCQRTGNKPGVSLWRAENTAGPWEVGTAESCHAMNMPCTADNELAAGQVAAHKVSPYCHPSCTRQQHGRPTQAPCPYFKHK
jgi:hypothetical protein